MTTATEDPTNSSKNSSSKKKDKSAKKKRKASKQILAAQKDHADLERARASEPLPLDESQIQQATAGALSKPASSNKKSPNKTPPGAPNSHTKDVKEAAGYLTNWKNYRAQWKFNKNTQSWLIRHMYESEKVAKSTFSLLLDYLEGLQGKGAKERILEDATRRALRYKQFEQGGTKEEEPEKEKTVQFSEDTKGTAGEEEKDDHKKYKKKANLDPTASEDEKRWNELSDHDKRKEYKRARKILETLKKESD